jgi:hypothetical protein
MQAAACLKKLMRQYNIVVLLGEAMSALGDIADMAKAAAMSAFDP